MKPYYEQDGIQIFHGDSREVVPLLGRTFDSVITDPVWPNASPDLAGHDDPAGLFAAVARYFPGLADRVVVQLGCDSDPRFIAGVPAELPFLRVCWLEYALARPKGRCLYSGDVAYVFGLPPRQFPGRMLMPGRMVSARFERTRPRRRASEKKAFEGRWVGHPCPRRLEHVAWQVRNFADGPILDPFMGSGTTLRAAKDASLAAVGIEVEERYCERAAQRLSQGVLFGAEAAEGRP